MRIVPVTRTTPSEPRSADNAGAFRRSVPVLRSRLADPKPIECWMTDMDGVLVHEGRLIPGADAFVSRLRETGTPFLVLTNNSIYTPRDLQFRLRSSGIDLPVESIWTSALATAAFLDDQRPQGSAYVVGEAGLTTALHEIGYVLTDNAPDYVVLGETRTYSFEAVTTAIRLIRAGARFVATNPDPTGPSSDGVLPATGAVAALMSRATGVEPVLHRQAEPADDAGRAQPAAGALGEHGDDRRPDGHRHRRRAGGRDAHRAGADRHRAGRRDRPVPVSAATGWCPRSPIWWTRSSGPGRGRRARAGPTPTGTPAWTRGRSRRGDRPETAGAAACPLRLRRAVGGGTEP